MKQFKLSRGPLLNKKGRLNESGYHKQLIKVYNRNNVKASRLKLKEWDYYLIYNDDYAVALTVADNGYIGIGSISFIDFKEPSYITKSRTMLLPLGKLKMPTSSYFGSTRFNYKGTFIEIKHEPKGRILKFSMDNFKGGNKISGEFLLSECPKDSMTTAVPFYKKPKKFYYNQKIVGMKASGIVKYKNEMIEFKPEDSYSILDWGRGVWPYRNKWYWSSAAGEVDGHKIGFNFGYGFGDTSHATEDMIFYDHKGFKLESVSFKVPKDPKGHENYLMPWEFTSSDDRFKAVFTPIIDRHDKINLGFLSTNQHQVFGRFTGYMITDTDKKIEFHNLLGFAEKVMNKW
jgi:hypothetical protein